MEIWLLNFPFSSYLIWKSTTDIHMHICVYCSLADTLDAYASLNNALRRKTHFCLCKQKEVSTCQKGYVLLCLFL